MTTARDVLNSAEKHLLGLRGHVFDVLTIAEPVSPAAAANLAKIVSKLSPLVGNLIEFNSVEILNEHSLYSSEGSWERQDPGFPDTVFRGKVSPLPGIEIKAWFPLSTEITARFKDSQLHFSEDCTDVAMLAWLPQHLIYGKPFIVDAVVVSGLSVARSRDTHYHNPPDYLVVEPGDTTARTRNLQQTNTNGFKWQGDSGQLEEAKRLVQSWGAEGGTYAPTPEYQRLCRELMARFPYRLDTNYAKMDRIVHKEIEDFKSRVLQTNVRGATVAQWARLFASGNEEKIASVLTQTLPIKKTDADALLE